jgi:hypothetical protein
VKNFENVFECKRSTDERKEREKIAIDLKSCFKTVEPFMMHSFGYRRNE